jgi:rubredoxin
MMSQEVPDERWVRGRTEEAMPVDQEKKEYKFRCTVCGFEITVDSPELPSDYVCPVCGVGADKFERVEE